MSINKAKLRAELFKYAAKGEFPIYSDMRKHLRPRISTGWRPEGPQTSIRLRWKNDHTAIQTLLLSCTGRMDSRVRSIFDQLQKSRIRTNVEA